MPSASKNFIVLQEVDSTNNYAMALVQHGEAINETGIFALKQTAGRGRLGAKWESRQGENIILSVIMQMQWLPVYQQFQLSVAAALGCTDFFSQFLKKGIKIKWPNDIYLNDSKAGGILIENQLQGNLWQWSVIGIGLNINEETFEGKDFKATSLKQVTGVQYDILRLARQLHLKVLGRIEAIKTGAFNEMLNEYNTQLFCSGRKVRLKKDNIVFQTIIEKVLPTGELLTRDTIERKFKFDEVKWVDLSETD